MSEHRIPEGEAKLPELIDRALAGEGVVITRDGEPVAELKAIVRANTPADPLDLEWIRKHRVGRLDPAAEDAGTFVSRMRDEEW